MSPSLAKPAVTRRMRAAADGRHFDPGRSSRAAPGVEEAWKSRGTEPCRRATAKHDLLWGHQRLPG